MRQRRFVLDGEAVILGVDGVSDFNALHSGEHNKEVHLCALDMLAMDGDDLRKLPLSTRKANLARLLARRRSQLDISPLQLALDDIECDLKREHGERCPTDDRSSRQDQESRHLNSPTMASIRGRPMNTKWG